MDSWGRAREVEKPKPFADRAEKCCSELAEYEAMLRRMFGGNFPLAYVLVRAEALLTEAIRRGVKGKDPDPR